jgi:hypothetical protein
MVDIVVEKHFWETSTNVRYSIDFLNEVYRVDDGDPIKMKRVKNLSIEKIFAMLQSELPDIWVVPTLCTTQIHINDSAIVDLLPLYLKPEVYTRDRLFSDFPKINAEYDSFDWDKLEEAAEILDRLIFVNFEPWAALVYSGNNLPEGSCVVPLEDFLNFKPWASFGWGETMSMISGIDSSSIGLLTSRVVLEISQLDDDQPFYSMSEFSDDVVKHLINWFNWNAIIEYIASTWTEDDVKILEKLFALCIKSGENNLEVYAGELLSNLSTARENFGMGLTDSSIWICYLNLSQEIRKRLSTEIEKILH